jgi:hypothetical protein
VARLAAILLAAKASVTRVLEEAVVAATTAVEAAAAPALPHFRPPHAG